MEIRVARLADVARMAEIAAQAFANEPIYSRFHPHQQAFPEDYQRTLARNYARIVSTPGQVAVVATVPQEQRGNTIVCGFATFIRSGPIPSHRRRFWNPDSVGKRLRRAWLGVTSFFDRDRSVDADCISSYYNQAAAIRKAYNDAASIEFRTLAVDPEYQRRGYGERLVEWCGIRAVQDGMPVYGDAAAIALPLYLRNGCKKVGEIVLEAKAQKTGGTNEQRRAMVADLRVVVLRWDSSSLKEIIKDHIDLSVEL